MASEETFKFDYQKYRTKKLSIEQLDRIFELAASPSSNIIDQIATGIRLAVIAVYLWSRMRLINEQELIEKQEYEIRRAHQGSGSIEEDDLDQLRSET